MTRKNIYISVFAILFFAFLFSRNNLIEYVLAPYKNASTASLAGEAGQSLDWRSAVPRWENSIKKIGPEKTLDKIKSEFGNQIDLQHSAMHYFGDLLYKSYGLKGILYCDQFGGYGCYHGILGSLLIGAERDPELLAKIDEICGSSNQVLRQQCYHGVGHGLMAREGFDYSESRLLEALKDCDKFIFDPLNSCDGGVFMEYNLWDLRQEAINFSEEIRPIGDDLYFPCNALPEKYASRCYFTQPKWWKRALNKNYKWMGELCSRASKVEYRESCFLGVGHEIAWLTPKLVKDSIALCNQMPEQRYAVLCLAGAASATYRQLKNPGLTKKICESLTYEDKEYCFEKLDFMIINH